MIGERIQEIRKENGLSQEEFGKRLAVSRNVVAKYENGLVEPPELFINHLCIKFGVSENWLKTGEGETYSAITEEDLFSEKLGKILASENDMIKDIISKASELDDDYLLMLHQLIDGMLAKQLKK
ncbi:helix-turn-helix domain-containing protein [Lysinibacillus fusiformis]|uniref:helix-turn-helix domain-containing protein n=1 Tax=Lysinibacillus fusiformis TaxID=28031 RepID=UPI00263B8980|nr:helix-turn-helix transcriptional regulator [Lysinibacillus fusiformis]MDC6267755.1 helix-turn-helix transcriptional regulator [Lysinibacillus sphaericus]MDN4967755.1 helix-turn-helix transcriptional regulator [Lysinibacillus fusiformis]MDN4967811.1 helix-turn-helix transcriptional regulator [Lysinibacillus fusiformis]